MRCRWLVAGGYSMGESVRHVCHWSQTSGSVELETGAFFEVTDITGRRLRVKPLTDAAGQSVYDFTDLGAGIYLWRIGEGEKTLARGKLEKR